MKFSDIAQPGIMISQAWPHSRSESGATLRAIEQVFAHTSFFEAVQTVDIPFADERRAVRKLVRDAGRPHTYTLTRVLGENKLNLSSLDPIVRQRSYETVIQKFDDALEAGADAIGLISGPRPVDPVRRDEALRALEDSLAQISAAGARAGLTILVEPLDYEAHKRCTLGTTGEAVAICDHLAKANLSLKLCLDVAHLVLNGESVVPAVAAARGHVLEFHFVNAVTDRAHPLFGDHHLVFGSPGVIDIPQIAGMMAGLARDGFFNAAQRPRVFCEVWKPDDRESLAVVDHCERALREGWDRGGTRHERCLK